MKSNKKGFTLIELLLVIAIIALFAAVVVTALSTSKTKGIDGGIKKQAVEIRGQAEVFFNNNSSSYLNLCDSGTSGSAYTMVQKLAAFSGATIAVNSGVAQTATTTNCNTSSSAYAISTKLVQPTTTTYLCIDSANKTLITTTPLGVGSTTCQ